MSSPSNVIGPYKGITHRVALRTRQRAGVFWRWWSGELTPLLPARWKELSSLGGSGPLLSLLADDLIVHEVRLGRLVELERVKLSSLDPAGQRMALKNLLAKRQSSATQSVRLCVDSTQYLKKTIRLPLATEENLREVLGFEMDRHTPFKADQVYFDYHIIKRDTEQAMIEVEIFLMPRLSLDALVTRVESLGAQVAAVLPAESVGQPVPAPNFFRQRSIARPVGSRVRNLNFALGGVLLLLLGVVLVIPVWQKRAAAIAFLAPVNKAKSAAEATEAVRKELEKLAEESNYILARKHAQPATLSLIEDVSRVLPDNTWIQVLELKSGAKVREIVLTGETASSSKLIEIIEQTGSLQNASFRSPLTQSQTPNSQRFVLGAEVKIKPLPALIAESDVAASASQAVAPMPAPQLPPATAFPANNPAAGIPPPAPAAPAVAVPIVPGNTPAGSQANPADGKAGATQPSAVARRPVIPAPAPGAPVPGNKP